MLTCSGTMANLLRPTIETGFPYPDRLIHLFVGGSELHGAQVQGTDDLDIYGVYIELPEMALGLDSLPHFVWSTAGDDRRNGPNDVGLSTPSNNGPDWHAKEIRRRCTSSSQRTLSRVIFGLRSWPVRRFSSLGIV